MTSTRTYRRALPLTVALAEIRRFAGTQFDPQLAEIMLTSDVRQLYRQLNEQRTAALAAVLPAAGPRGAKSMLGVVP